MRFDPKQASQAAGVNLIGTKCQGMDARQLRAANPELAAKWLKFIIANKTALVKSIAERVS